MLLRINPGQVPGGIDRTFKGDYHKNHGALLPSRMLPPDLESKKAGYKRRRHRVPLITRANLEEIKVFRKIIAIIFSGSMIFGGLIPRWRGLLLGPCPITPPLDLSEIAAGGTPPVASSIPFYPQTEFQCGP